MRTPCPHCRCPWSVQDLIERDADLERQVADQRRRAAEASRADHIHGSSLAISDGSSDRWYVDRADKHMVGNEEIQVCARCGTAYLNNHTKVVRSLRFMIRARMRHLDPVSSIGGIAFESELDAELGPLQVEQGEEAPTDG